MLYRISIKGVDHNFRHDGLKPSAFAELTINANGEKIEIEAFDITPARGNSAVSIHEVRDNIFDLNDVRAPARSGDKLGMEIKLRHKTGSSKSSNAFVAIRVM